MYLFLWEKNSELIFSFPLFYTLFPGCYMSLSLFLFKFFYLLQCIIFHNFLRECAWKFFQNLAFLKILSFLASHLNDSLAWYKIVGWEKKIVGWKQFSLKIIGDATHQPVVPESGILRYLSRRMAVTRMMSNGSVYWLFAYC